MKLKHVYLALSILGCAIPLWSLVPFFKWHGLNPWIFFTLLTDSPVGRFFGWDALISGIVLICFVIAEGKRLNVRLLWLPIAATLTVGVSFGLPMFLYMRQVRLEHNLGSTQVAERV